MIELKALRKCTLSVTFTVVCINPYPFSPNLLIISFFFSSYFYNPLGIQCWRTSALTTMVGLKDIGTLNNRVHSFIHYTTIQLTAYIESSFSGLTANGDNESSNAIRSAKQTLLIR